MTIIFKDFIVPPRTVAAIDIKQKEMIQDWLNLVEITFTEGPKSIAWGPIMNEVRAEVEAGVFYEDEDEDGEKKPVGWNLLSVESDDEEEDQEDPESEYEDASEEEEDSEEDSDDDDSEFEEEDDDESYDEDEENALEEQGQDWDDLERDAMASDKAKRTYGDDDGGGGPARGAKKPRR